MSPIPRPTPRARRRVLPAGAAILVAAFALLPGWASAQASILVGGSAAVPLAGFGDVADVGFRVEAGGTAPLGRGGALARAVAFYGRNAHRIAGDRSELYGATVLAGYELDLGSDVRLTPWIGIGGAVHARKSEAFPGLEASKRGLTVTGGGTVSKGVGRVRVLASVFYLRGLGDLGGDAFPTQLVTLGGGLEIPLGID